MSTTTRVFIAFDLAASGQGDFFTLNDPIKGQLGASAYPLAGDILTEVTEDVRGVTVRRGRSWQLDKFNAGAADVTLANTQRQYDPSNAVETATRTNLIPNPSFEADTAGWTTASTALTSGGASVALTGTSLFGAAAAAVTSTNTSDNQGLTAVLSGLAANTTYIFSGYVLSQQGNGVYLTARDDTNAVAGTQSTTTTSGAWTRLSCTLTTGASTASATVGFVVDSSFPAPQVFTLDDPVAGVLDDADYPLQPDPVTDAVFLVDAVLCETGTSLEPYFDGDEADGTILFPETAWTGVPNSSTSTLSYGVPGTGSPYFPGVKPRKEIQVTVNDLPVFTGTIEDWDFQFSVAGDATATTRAVDGFARLAQTLITPVAVPSESPGARIARILDLNDVQWPAGSRNLDSGESVLAAQNIGGDTDPTPVNTLAYLQQVEQAEPGALYITGDGVLRFRGRESAQSITPVVFSDDGQIPFIDVSIDYGIENVRNQVIANRLGGSLLTAESPDSINEYGVVSYQLQDVLLADDDQLEDLAAFILRQYADPKIRIDRITVDLEMLTSSQLSSVLALDLGDVVRVRFTPQRVGQPIDRYLTVDALEHSIAPRAHRLTLDLSDAIIGFILDDPTFGVLDSSNLGF